MKNTTIIGKTITKSHGSLTRRYTVESIVEQDGWHIACLRETVAPHGIVHEKSTKIDTLTTRLERMVERVDMAWLTSRLDLLNVSEVAKQAGIPRTRISDAVRGKAQLTPDDFAAIKTVIARIA